MDVVTADGELRTATPTDEPDLFFALRGSKGNVGVVTAVEFELFPITTVYGGGLWFAGERLAEVLPAWRDRAATLPEDASTSIGIQRLPALPDLPEPLRAPAQGCSRLRPGSRPRIPAGYDHIAMSICAN